MSDVPDPLANLDQLLRGLGDLAQVISTYYGELVTRGFTTDQALAMTMAYQQIIVGQ